MDALGLELDEQAKDDIAVNGVVEAVLKDYAEDAEGAVVQKLLEDLEADEVESLDVCKAVAQRLQKVLKNAEQSMIIIMLPSIPQKKPQRRNG